MNKPGDEYVPELGQMVFGQPTQSFVLPSIAAAALQAIQNELSRVMWNRHQEELPDPFGNTGASYKNDTFEVQAYSWDESKAQPYNFKWKDVRISWYKYLGRGMSCNIELTPDMCSDMLEDCLRSLRGIDRATIRDRVGLKKEDQHA